MILYQREGGGSDKNVKKCERGVKLSPNSVMSYLNRPYCHILLFYITIDHQTVVTEDWNPLRKTTRSEWQSLSLQFWHNYAILDSC